MRHAHKAVLIVLVVLLIATVYGLVQTRQQNNIEAGNGPALKGKAKAIQPEESPLVDQAAFLTAQALVRMPASAAEIPFAQQALQFGDREMDLAFASAVLDATQHPPALTAEARQIQARLQKAQDELAAGQAEITRLTADEGKASGAQKDALDDQLTLAKAQLELAQDEVDDAKGDLIEAGGDPQGRIQAMVQEHEETSHASDNTMVATRAGIEPRGLIQRFQQWWTLHQKQLQLWRAREDALLAAAALAEKHNALAQQIDERDKKFVDAAITVRAAPSGAATAAKRAELSRPESAAMVVIAKLRAADSKTLATFDKRVDSEQNLAYAYAGWIGVVATEQRSLVNGGLRGVLIILAIAIIGLFMDDWIGGLLGKLSMERRRMETVRTATSVALQIVGVLLVLLVIFGPPTQLGTILGLAGAGLTVALKDFIIGFLGWFVLMGKNGIRMGDWVEINGVTGEVVELGMFHTVLLETGNWTDSGHPTGRRVTFTNSFAIEGHYFNFSTSGQWLWDELHIVLPAGRNPYPIVDAIRKTVTDATADSTRQAEQEWRGSGKPRGLHALSAAPAIDFRPVVGGTEIAVRYIARATERSELRAKLNHAAVDLLEAGTAPQSGGDSSKPAVTSS